MAFGENGIIFAGNLIVDQLKFVKEWPRQTDLTQITHQAFSFGGLANNCSMDMAQLAPEVPVRVVGVVGNDSLGDSVVERLSGYESIDTSGVIRAGETSFTDVVTTPDGTRTFFQFPGAGSLLGPEHFDFTKLRADIFHIGYILLLDKLHSEDPDYPTGMCRVLDAAQKAGMLTATDMVSLAHDRFKEIAIPALAYTDILTINDTEAESATDIALRDAGGILNYDALEACVRALAGFGVGKWVCVHMPEISAGIDIESGEYMTAKTLSLPDDLIKSTVGAGDAFAAGLLYAAYRGLTLAEALDEGNTVAAYSLRGIGASDAIIPLSELLAEMEQYK